MAKNEKTPPSNSNHFESITLDRDQAQVLIQYTKQHENRVGCDGKPLPRNSAYFIQIFPEADDGAIVTGKPRIIKLFKNVVGYQELENLSPKK